MKKILITMVLGLCLVSTSAFADANANAGSTSSAGATSGSSAYTGPQSQGQTQGQAAYGGNQGQTQGQAAYGGQQGQSQSINLGAGTAGSYGVAGGTRGTTSGAPLSPVSLAGVGDSGNSSNTNLNGNSNVNGSDNENDNSNGVGVGVGIDLSDHSTTRVEAADLGDAVPSVFAAGVTAGGSNPCVVSVGGGASFSGGGFNFARAYNDGECQVRESLRLMVAILPNNADKGSQMLIRETACQSDIYWQSMERVYINTKDDRFLCTNPRPDNKPIAIRDRAMEKVVTTANNKPVTTNYESAQSNHNGFF